MPGRCWPGGSIERAGWQVQGVVDVGTVFGKLLCAGLQYRPQLRLIKTP